VLPDSNLEGPTGLESICDKTRNTGLGLEIHGLGLINIGAGNKNREIEKSRIAEIENYSTADRKSRLEV
jgi:hypothetical protein